MHFAKKTKRIIYQMPHIDVCLQLAITSHKSCITWTDTVNSSHILQPWLENHRSLADDVLYDLELERNRYGHIGDLTIHIDQHDMISLQDPFCLILRQAMCKECPKELQEPVTGHESTSERTSSFPKTEICTFFLIPLLIGKWSKNMSRNGPEKEWLKFSS